MKKEQNEKWQKVCDKYDRHIINALTDIYQRIDEDTTKYGILLVHEDTVLSNIFCTTEVMNILTPATSPRLIQAFAVHNTEEPIEKLTGAILYLVYEQLENTNKLGLN